MTTIVGVCAGEDATTGEYIVGEITVIGDSAVGKATGDSEAFVGGTPVCGEATVGEAGETIVGEPAIVGVVAGGATAIVGE